MLRAGAKPVNARVPTSSVIKGAALSISVCYFCLRGGNILRSDQFGSSGMAIKLSLAFIRMHHCTLVDIFSSLTGILSLVCIVRLCAFKLCIINQE